MGSSNSASNNAGDFGGNKNLSMLLNSKTPTELHSQATPNDPKILDIIKEEEPNVDDVQLTKESKTHCKKTRKPRSKSQNGHTVSTAAQTSGAD